MKYTCPYCDYRMSALEADAAYDGCPSCRHRIAWDLWMNPIDIEELENNAIEERINSQLTN